MAGWRGLGRLAAVTAAGTVAVSAVAVPAQVAVAQVSGGHGHAPRLPRVEAVRGVGRLAIRTVRHRNPAARRARVRDASWPAAGSATVRLTGPVVPFTAPGAGPQAGVLFGTGGGPGGAGKRVPGLPVWIRPTLPPSALTGARVRVLGHAAAVAAGVTGVLVEVSRAAGSPPGTVQVGLDYRRFSQIYGGNFGPSLSMTELPACAVTTPAQARCRGRRPLGSAVNDAAAGSVSAVVPVPRRGSLVLAASPSYSDGGGPAGSYTATTLRASGTWAAGGSTGAFTYSYPMAVPPAASKLVPPLSLDYNSQAVDGQTSASQAQSSWVGDGWSLPHAFIEQSFTPCQDKPEGSASPKSTPDQCYDGPVLTLSLNGTSVPLVCPVPFSYTATSTCTAASDTGEVVTHHVNAGNGSGTKFTDYWTVTTRDGTTYSFGLNHLPGWSSGNRPTNSTDWLPVFSAHAGDPCYSGSGFGASACDMAYRWNLDYVTDVHGNAMAYYYQQDTNAYAQNGATSSATSYIRDSHLDHIDYGFTDGHAYAGHAPDQVSFTTGDRCFGSACDPIGSHASNWQDVPYSNHCDAGSSCQTTWPTFWSTVRLTTVTAQQWNGTAYLTADSWALAQHFPPTGDGTSPALWLDSIIRTGADTTAGGGAVPLPAVTFAGTQFANRLNYSNYLPLLRYRITGVTTETGSVIGVTYTEPQQCSASALPTPSDNNQSCFPVFWQQFTSSPDWFNKWAVQKVSQSDPTGGSPGLFTSYTYSGPAWHYDDNELVKAKYRSYAQWRGYQDVKTYSGTGSTQQTETETTYYQGMSNDNNSTAVTLTDSQGGKHDDTNQLAGNVLEATSYTYAGSSPPVGHSTINSYWVSAAAASRTRSGLPDLTANASGLVEEWTRQAITDGGTTTWRKTETDTTYQASTSSASFGLPLFTYAHGDLSDPSQQTCTATTYAPANTGENLVGLPAEVETDAQPCGGSSPGGASAPGPGQVNALTAPASLSRPADVISDTRTFYDNPSLAQTWPQPANPTWPQATPASGDVSVVRQATDYSGGAFSYQTKSAAVYDSYGRPVASYDGDGNKTATAYTMTNGVTTAVKTTNALGQSATTTLDPLRGVSVSSSDMNAITSTLKYDGLGRLISVWTNSRPATKSNPANYQFSYAVSNSAPSVVTTMKLNDGGGYNTSTALYDALLRLRQTQTPTPAGGSLISDTFYDSHGWTIKTNHSVWSSGTNPGPGIVPIHDSQVPNQTVTAYDGLGRPVQVTSYNDSAVVSNTYTAYYGDRVTTVPAKGATPTSTVTDAQGRTTELDQYASPPSVSTGTNPGGFTTVTITGGTTQPTSYSYNHRGELSDIKASGQDWTRSYNLLGQVTAATDPNAGTITTSYDGAGNVLTTTGANAHPITYGYDALNRKTGEYDGPNTASPPIATWAYDNSNNAVPGMTNPIGHLTTETSHSGGNAYILQQNGFNVFGESLGQTLTLPSAEGGLAGTYTLTHSYTATTGLPYKDIYPASGSLPAETITHIYKPPFDLPYGLGSSIAAYVQSTIYTAFSQPAQENLGTLTNHTGYITNTYDPHTGTLTDTQVSNSAASPALLDDTSYTFDPAGNITAQTDKRNGGTATETQCFAYDTLDRLNGAWTSTDNCKAPPSTGGGGNVGDGITGGTYWTSWTYNPLGDQGTQNQHSITGGTDTLTTYNGNGAGQPDTLTKAATTGPGAGTATYTYDPSGNTITRNLPAGNQTLTWTHDGKLATATTPAGTTSYIYDASGNLLLQKDPHQTTLYIFGEQIVLSGANITGARFLRLPAGGLAVRTGGGTSYSYEITDQHGTSLLTLDNTAANPQWRQYTPYGAPRGTPPGTWPDTNGYLSKPTATNTGLTIVGARQYDPSTGRFISIDPVLNASDQQQLNGYSYAAGNPATRSDPSGLCPQADLCQGIPQPGSTPQNIQYSAPYNPCTWNCNYNPTPGQLAYLRNLGYQGSRWVTTPDLIRWLSNVSPTRQNAAWDFFCQGLASASASQCGHNPLNGQGTYDNGLRQISSIHGLAGFARIAYAITATFAPAFGAPEIGVGSELASGVIADGSLTIAGSGFSTSELTSARYLYMQGNNVVLRTATGVGRTSDLLINGIQYDVYTPTTGSVSRIVGAVASKSDQVSGGGVVIDLSKSPLTVADLANVLSRVQGVTSNVSDVIVIP